MPSSIKISARSSPLSRRQVEEVEKTLGINFETTYLKTTGDLDLKTSLRGLNKTDFFTKEIDDSILQGKAQIAIHSAKDLPEPLPNGLKVIAITRGLDPRDSLVLRDEDTLISLPKGALIATSSERREEAVKLLRDDFAFCDVRGTIEDRLQGLFDKKYHGVVIAECALLRLNLAHLNRIKLFGKTTPYQGQLAIVAREGDLEMERIFAPLDSRNFKRALYLGPEFPRKSFLDKSIIFNPIIKTKFLPLEKEFSLKDYTHIILTSKVAVEALISALRERKIPLNELQEKQVLAIGLATQEVLYEYGITNCLVADVEQSEGMIPLLDNLSSDVMIFYPHSSLSRKVIQEALSIRKISFEEQVLYETLPNEHYDEGLVEDVEEVIFSSPSTVAEFFEKHPAGIPSGVTAISIGAVTEAAFLAAVAPH